MSRPESSHPTSGHFGDGTNSTEQNPSHLYAAAGTYTVKLKVTGPGGSNTMTRQSYITVSKVALPVSRVLRNTDNRDCPVECSIH